MTPDELLRQVLHGNLIVVGDYRGSHAEMAGYVDKKSGQAIRSVRAIHLVECVWYDRVDRVVLMQYFGGGATLNRPRQHSDTSEAGGTFCIWTRSNESAAN